MEKEDFNKQIQSIQDNINILIEEADDLSKESGFSFVLNIKCNCIQRAIESRKVLEEHVKSYWPKHIARYIIPIDKLPDGALPVYHSEPLQINSDIEDSYD